MFANPVDSTELFCTEALWSLDLFWDEDCEHYGRAEEYHTCQEHSLCEIDGIMPVLKGHVVVS